eukprot:5788325-Heterocapsa_arctica.AAC.1
MMVSMTDKKEIMLISTSTENKKVKINAVLHLGTMNLAVPSLTTDYIGRNCNLSIELSKFIWLKLSGKVKRFKPKPQSPAEALMAMNWSMELVTFLQQEGEQLGPALEMEERPTFEKNIETMDRIVLLREVPKVHTCAPPKADGLEIAAVTWSVSQDWKTEWDEGTKSGQVAEAWNGKPYDKEGKTQEGRKE